MDNVTKQAVKDINTKISRLPLNDLNVKNIYSLRDLAGGFFGITFLQSSDLAAVRDVQEAVKSGNSNLAKYPQHFELWLVGTFNSITGVIEPGREIIINMADAENFINSQR